MTGQQFVNKINKLDNCITMFDDSIAEQGNYIKLNLEQQSELRNILWEYRKRLLDAELNQF